MAKLFVPPPTIQTLITFVGEWVAKNLRARVTITVYFHENKQFTEVHDGRG